MPNSAPTLNDLNPTVTYNENEVNAAPALIDADVSFDDRDANVAGGVILVSGLLAEDRVAIRDQGLGAGQIGLLGVNVTYGGVAIGTWSGGSGDDLTIELNSSATVAAVEALIENLTYANVSDTPTASRTLTIEVRDGSGAAVSGMAAFTRVDPADSPFDMTVANAAAPIFVDLDRDGDQDLIIGDLGGNIRLFRNDGAAYTELTGPSNPLPDFSLESLIRPAFADLDGDGDQDLVVGSSAFELRVFMNFGAFVAAGVIDVDTYDAAPAFGDVDGDGDLDLVVGRRDGGLSFLRNDGGTFNQQFGADNPFDGLDFGIYSSVAVADLDGDGDDDLVVGAFDGRLVALENQNGSFAEFAVQPYPSGVSSTWVPAFLDADGDGDLDSVVGTYAGDLVLFRNDTPPGREVEIQVTAQIDIPSLTDLEARVSYLANDLRNAPALLDADVDLQLGSADLDGGRLILSGLLPTDRITIIEDGVITVSGNEVSHEGTVIGTFSGGQGTSFIVEFGANAGAIEAEALIEHLGFAVTSATPEPLRNLHFSIVDSTGGALGGPAVFTPFPINPLAFFTDPDFANTALAFVDLDGDQDLDIVVGQLTGVVLAYRNDGGAYVELTGADNPFASIDLVNNSRPVFLDLDGDGDRDLIVGGDGGVVETYRNDSGTYVLLTGADDPFDGVTTFQRNMAPAPADVDGDGDIDLLFGSISNTTPGILQYFENDGSGFVERTGPANPFDGVTLDGYPSPAWADLDGDGDLDLMVAHGFANPEIRVWRNDGGGNFTELVGPDNPLGSIYLSGSYSARPVVNDIDGDGDFDLLFGTGLGHVRSFRNDSDPGPFITVQVTAAGTAPSMSGLAGSATFAETMVNAGATLLDGDVQFNAGTSGMDGGMLTVTGLDAEDEVTILTDATIVLAGSTLSYLGTDIGTVAGGDGATLTVTFTAAADSAAIEAVIERLAYANSSDTPTPSRTLTLDVVDGNGDGLSGGPQAIVVNVTPENDAPRLTNLNSASFAENAVNAAPAIIDSTVDFFDPDGTMAMGRLTVTSLLPEDRIAIRNEGLGTGQVGVFGINVTYGGVAIGTFSGGVGSNFALSFNSAATDAAVEAVIANLTYANVSDTPTANRILVVSVIDAAGAADTVPLTISVAGEGDLPPVAVDDSLTTAEDRAVAGNLFADNGAGPDFDPDGSPLIVEAVDGLAGNLGSTIMLASGARLRVNADGSYVYNPNGAFDYLGAPGSGPPSTATDSFTYTLAGGNSATATVTISWVDGDDQLYGTSGDDTLHGGVGKDRLYGRGGNDELGGGPGNDSLYGDAGDDRLDGGAGRDRLEGGMGDDMLFGGDDMDMLIGGKGADQMAGSDGDDLYIVDHFDDVVVEDAGGGKDRVLSSVSFTLPDHVERLHLSGGGDSSGRGNALDNEIRGNGGDNYLSGYGGDDRIEGGDGDDILIGGRGLDTLIGGSGQDMFLFNTSPAKSNTDRIYDFESGEDRMVLDEDLFAAAGRGTLSADAFHLGATAQDAEDRILYDASTGRIYFDPDGTGSVAAVMFAAVTVGTPLVHSDFMIG